jgi:hypothetical protein
VGANGEASYDPVSFTMDVSDLLVMTTNGITETRDPANSSCRGRAFYLPSRWTFRLHLTPSAASPWPTCATGRRCR